MGVQPVQFLGDVVLQAEQADLLAHAGQGLVGRNADGQVLDGFLQTLQQSGFGCGMQFGQVGAQLPGQGPHPAALFLQDAGKLRAFLGAAGLEGLQAALYQRLGVLPQCVGVQGLGGSVTGAGSVFRRLQPAQVVGHGGRLGAVVHKADLAAQFHIVCQAFQVQGIGAVRAGALQAHPAFHLAAPDGGRDGAAQPRLQQPAFVGQPEVQVGEAAVDGTDLDVQSSERGVGALVGVAGHAVDGARGGGRSGVRGRGDGRRGLGGHVGVWKDGKKGKRADAGSRTAAVGRTGAVGKMPHGGCTGGYIRKGVRRGCSVTLSGRKVVGTGGCLCLEKR